MENNKYFTTVEAAKILKIHPQTLRLWELKKLVKSGKTLGGHRRFLAADISRLKESIYGN